MQRAFDAIFDGRPVANCETIPETRVSDKLALKLAHLSDDQIAALEDELDFYTFTGLMGNMMRELLCGQPEPGMTHKAVSRPAAFVGRPSEGWRRAG